MKCPNCNSELKDDDLIRGVCPSCKKLFDLSAIEYKIQFRMEPVKDKKPELGNKEIETPKRDNGKQPDREIRRNDKTNYCSHCGRATNESDNFCPSCGRVISSIPTETSGLAIASLVLGILGFTPLLLVLGSVLAVIFGRSARKKIKKNPSIRGEGMATAGIILGNIGIITGLLALFFIVKAAMPKKAPLPPPASIWEAVPEPELELQSD